LTRQLLAALAERGDAVNNRVYKVRFDGTAICSYDRLTSTPAVRGANNWGVIQFDEEGRVIPTWEDDDDGDAA
jgi:hypothetical protein